VKLAFIIDPIELLDPGHDTSVALMESAQLRGHEVLFTQIEQLTVLQGKAHALLTPVTLVPVKLLDQKYVIAEQWYELGEPQWLPLEEMDAIWMRKDPPVDSGYLYATYILDLVDPSKTKVLNSPEGLRNANEKMYTLQFPSLMPETIVSQDRSIISDFVKTHGQAILKPLHGKAGEGILYLSQGDRNINSLVEISTKQNKEPVMVQTYIPAAVEGDKRIIMLNGEPIGAINRIPTGGEFRGNMAVGGRVAQVDITERDYEICSALSARLRSDGLYFVGIDVIGGYLTEVNVTSPTGVREIDRFNNTILGLKVMEWLENSQKAK